MASRLAAILVAAAAATLGDAALAVDGQVTHLSGAVIARNSQGQGRILSVRSEVREGDLIITADNTYLRMKFSDGGDVVLRPNTQFKIDAYSYNEQEPASDNTVFSLLKGGMRAVTGLLGKRNPSSYKLATPTATIGIRGTQFGALFCSNDCGGVSTVGGARPSNGLHIDVSDGAIVVTNRAGSQEFKVGEFGFVASVTTAPAPVPPAQGTRITPPPMMLNQSSQGGAVGKAGEQECAVN